MRLPAIVSVLPFLCACGTPRDAEAPPPAASASAAAPSESSPAPADTASTARASDTPSPVEEAAIVASPRGLVLVSVQTGESSIPWKGAVQACVADPAAGAVWFLGRAAGETSLYAYDLRIGGDAAVIAPHVPAEAEAIAVTSWRGGKIESAPITDFELGVHLDVRSTPRLQRLVGGMVDTETLRPELEQIAARIDSLTVGDPGTAKRLGDRSGGALARSLPEVASRVDVPTAPCEVDAEACGSARKLPGTELQLVVVATSRGDLYHESVVLHDPSKGVFMSLADPRKTSRTADAAEVAPVELSQLWVAPSGLAYAYGERVVHLANGPLHVEDPGGGVACGFTNGGERVTTLRG